MHPFAARVVRRVQGSGGAIPLPDAWPDLAELERLAQAISKRAEPRIEEVEAPLYIKGEAFHQPTVGAIAWARRVSEWFSHEPELAELALLYGLKQAKSREYLDMLDADAARAAVHRWALRSRVTVAEAREVLALLFPAQRETDTGVSLKALRMEYGDDPTKWPETGLREAVAAWLKMVSAVETASEDRSIYKSVIFSVMREFGGTLDYWIFDVSLDRLLAAADEILKKQEAELAADKKARGGAAAERWAIEAQARFNVFAKAFERKYGRASAASKPQHTPSPSAPPSATNSTDE